MAAARELCLYFSFIAITNEPLHISKSGRAIVQLGYDIHNHLTRRYISITS
jgi:hypothetical protein